MLGHFPPGYRDEAFVNICARYQEHVGDTSSIAVAKTLFGAQGPVHLYWPIRLGNLLEQLPSEFGLSVDLLIDEHTLAPMLLPFLSNSAMIELREYMGGCDASRRLGMIAAAHESWCNFKYCPQCAKEVRDKFGEAYWHRDHQPSFIEVCSVHECFLHVVQNHKALQGTLIPADNEIPLQCPTEVADLRSPQVAVKLWIARQVRWLLDNPRASISADNTATAFTRRFAERGLLTTRGLPDFRRIRASFRDYLKAKVEIDDEWLERYMVHSDRSLQIAIRFQSGPPGLLFLLMNWLGIDAESLPTISANVHFENGPWPCLNKVCRFYGQDVIENYTLGYSHNSSGDKRGVFGCECGFSYSRQAPDLDGHTRTKPNKIITTGKQWEERLAAFWSDPKYTLPEIATELGCSTTQVQKTSNALDLPLRNGRPRSNARCEPTRSGFEEKRASYRKQILEFKRQFRGAVRTDFYGRLRRQIQWMLKNDREWLDKTLPKCKQGGPKVDWRHRDLSLSREILGLREEFIEQEAKTGNLHRISKDRFLAALGIHYSAVRQGRYSHTLAAIGNATESSAEFKIRRLFWILENDHVKIPSTFLALLAKVEIRLKERESKVFKSSLRSAEALFSLRIKSRPRTIAA